MFHRFALDVRAGSIALFLAAASLTPLAAGAQDPAATNLEAGFASPPNSARPRVWWHWMNGNITKEGIQKDIDWMSRMGVGGLQTFDVSLFTPEVVQKRLVYMSPEWKDAFRYATVLADQKGLEMAIAASPGWSETGGPWVKPEDGMKKLVWSETLVPGGRRFQSVLAAPPRVTGRFADQPLEGSILGPPDPNAPAFYQDAAVVAYRVPDTIQPVPSPTVTTGGGVALEADALGDGRMTTGVAVPRGAAREPAVIELTYPQSVTVRAVRIALRGVTGFGAAEAGTRPRLEVQDTQGAWSTVTELLLGGAPQSTISFAPRTARRFRVVFPAPPTAGPPFGAGSPGAEQVNLNAAAAPNLELRELLLLSEPTVNQYEVKAGFGTVGQYYNLDRELADDAGAPAATVIDLTRRMTAEGRLDWTPPSGTWKVLRLGYSLTGTTNHPTTKEASGLEVDKMDAAAVRRYMETYLSMYAEAAGHDLMGMRGVQALLTDSIEAGAANWSPGILRKFRQLRGYDPTPWLPTLTGAIIGSRSQSEAFLYDWRRTQADLMVSEHYATVAKVAHERGLKVYGEAAEGQRNVLGDDLEMRRHADIPMAALWTYGPEGPAKHYRGDMKGAASVAHFHGQNLVAAESLTSAMSPWAFAPHDLKPAVDFLFASGINRPVIHTSVHQPLDDKQPGFSLFIFGQYFNRHETWAEMARPWVDYMSRSAFLLQQGRDLSDVAYFIGEERPSGAMFGDGAIKEPSGYAYDLVNAEMLDAVTVRDGRIVSPAGARYRVIYLGGDSVKMTVPVLRRLTALAQSGATIIGTAPAETPSKADSPAEFRRLVSRLWRGGPTTVVGRGRVISTADLDQGLTTAGLVKDFAYDDQGGQRQVLFVHRTLPNAEIYFLTNRRDRAESFDAVFRVTGKTPEIWRAETGRAETVTWRAEGGQTRVRLEMAPEDAYFVVFRNPANGRGGDAITKEWRTVQTLGGAWEVAFQPGRGAPPRTTLSNLASLSENSNPGVKYFSGVATYTKSFTAPQGPRDQRVMLDLGQVGDLAEVYVNGQLVGTPWKAPFKVDVTDALQPGENRLEVKVANLWVNRLIGDKQPGAEKITFTTAPTYKPDAPLRPSGLIGPVTLQTSP